jgi:hypothetical protein
MIGVLPCALGKNRPKLQFSIVAHEPSCAENHLPSPGPGALNWKETNLLEGQNHVAATSPRQATALLVPIPWLLLQHSETRMTSHNSPENVQLEEGGVLTPPRGSPTQYLLANAT